MGGKHAPPALHVGAAVTRAPMGKGWGCPCSSGPSAEPCMDAPGQRPVTRQRRLLAILHAKQMTENLVSFDGNRIVNHSGARARTSRNVEP